ncbi:DUF4880 domain-containing protein [Sphingomonas koreensis]|nr:DUF4880 domain-containing protein [Sphingomonas koreensis]
MAWRFWESSDQRNAREAADWRVEMLEPASTEVRRAFEAWRAADPARAKAYAELEPFSSLATRLPSPARGQPRQAHAWRPAFGAAIIALFIVGGALLLGGRGAAPAFAAVTNAGPAVRVMRLGDGSTVALDRGSALSVRVGAKFREVRLKGGRARFEVAPGGAQPFVICANTGCVQTTGGVVDVALGTSYLDVVSIQGAAVLLPKASGTARSVGLASGAAVRLDGATVISTSVSRRQRLWPMARVGFQAAPLAAIVKIANRIARPPIRLDSEALATLPVTGVLDLRDSHALAAKLAAALNLHVKETAGAIVLARST